jgi:c-di-GMP-binding flagellar brake protein YcgR
MADKNGYDFDFVIPSDEYGVTKRQAYRAPMPGLRAQIHDGPRLRIYNMSISGAAYQISGQDARGYARLLKEGSIFVADLMGREKIIIAGVEHEVVRMTEDLLGCQFVNLSPRQEAKLDKLVLEVQKRMISMRKKSEEKE